jgi:hypothetical protein
MSRTRKLLAEKAKTRSMRDAGLSGLQLQRKMMTAASQDGGEQLKGMLIQAMNDYVAALGMPMIRDPDVLKEWGEIFDGVIEELHNRVKKVSIQQK